MAEIFKAYDIRGVYPEEINADIVKNIGKAFVTFLQCEKLIIGNDMRPSADELVDAFAAGATEMGCSVIKIGKVCTDATYFASGKLNLPAIMFTASHNPPEYNGMKFSKAGAVPINKDTGIDAMKEIVSSGAFKAVSDTPGTVEEKDVVQDYAAHVHTFVDTSKLKKLKVGVDAGNGMAGKMIPAVFDSLRIEIVPLFFELDGTFPNHLADPSRPENLKWLQDAVKEQQLDFGMGFDGDADRIFFVDENAEVVNSSLITSLIAKTLLEKNPGSAVIHNLVVSHCVPETISKFGGKPVEERVGHSFIKQTMRKENAVFGGEHSAHYYYRDNYYADSGIISAIIMCDVLSRTDQPLSKVLDEFRTYNTLAETSVKVDDKDAKIAKVKEHFSAQNPTNTKDYDGVTFEFSDWWFNVRASNTEPLLRLNMESKDAELLEAKKNELLALLD